MKGYKAEIGSKEAKSSEYFDDVGNAISWIAESLRFEMTELKQTERIAEIKEIELKVCTGIEGCMNLIPVDERECLKCEKLKGDALIEQEERERNEDIDDSDIWVEV